MTQKDYEYLLVTANLAHYHPTWGFTILADRLKMFLRGHRFYISADGTAGSFEVATKKINLSACILWLPPKHRVKVHVICIGQITDQYVKKIEWQKDGDDRMITTPPQLSGLRLQQQSFLENNGSVYMDLCYWNCMDVKEGDSNDDSSNDKDESVKEPLKDKSWIWQNLLYRVIDK
jgi:hypothetical protein